MELYCDVIREIILFYMQTFSGTYQNPKQKMINGRQQLIMIPQKYINKKLGQTRKYGCLMEICNKQQRLHQDFPNNSFCSSKFYEFSGLALSVFIVVNQGCKLFFHFPEPPANSRITLLNPENYQDKLKLIDQSKTSHMTTWKANQVLAWLEIVLNMPMYGKKCATNIKSGKVS